MTDTDADSDANAPPDGGVPPDTDAGSDAAWFAGPLRCTRGPSIRSYCA